MTSDTRERAVEGVTCVHHWIIEAPNGPESAGRCRRCDATRIFMNSQESVMWEQRNTLRSQLELGASPHVQPERRLSDEAGDDL